MAKKGPNHPHQRDAPSQRTTAPSKAGNQEAPGPSGPDQERHQEIGQGQFGGAGQPPLMKK